MASTRKSFFQRRLSKTLLKAPNSSTTERLSTPLDVADTGSFSTLDSSAGESMSSVPSSPATSYTSGPPSEADVEALDKPFTPALPPAYAPAVYPSTPANYTFTQKSPFAMTVSSRTEPGRTLYHISVGLNVWMPSSTVTYLRRGSNADGPLVAQLEMGITAGSANVTFAEECRPLGSVMFRKSAGSSSRYYFSGDGAIIRWKLGASEWVATVSSTPLATFTPSIAQSLTVQPAGNAYFDHLVVALLVLMREHLTPLAGLSGDAAGLFNYSNSTVRSPSLGNQEW